MSPARRSTALSVSRRGATDQVRDEVARGALVRVLEEYSAPFPVYSLYYPQRRHASAALRAFINYVRRMNRS